VRGISSENRYLKISKKCRINIDGKAKKKNILKGKSIKGIKR